MCKLHDPFDAVGYCERMHARGLQLLIMRDIPVQVSKLLQYSPTTRLKALDALSHPFFDELRDPATRMPNGAQNKRLASFPMQPQPVSRSGARHLCALGVANWRQFLQPHPSSVTVLYRSDCMLELLNLRMSCLTCGCGCQAWRPRQPLLNGQARRAGPNPNFNADSNGVAQGGRCHRCSIGSPRSWTAAPQKCKPS